MIIDRSNKASIHVQLRGWLIDELKHYSADQKLPTEFEIAERFEVSRLTVHKVMAELQHDGYLIRRRGRGTFVASRDKRIHTGNGNGPGSRGTVVIAYPDWFSADIWGKVEAAERLALHHGFRLVNFKITKESMYQSLRPLLQAQKDLSGVIVIPPGAAITPDLIEVAADLPVPVALLVPVDAAELPPNVYAISQDFRQMGSLDIHTLVDAGHRSIAYVAAEPWSTMCELEYAGMKEALYERNLLLRDLRRPERRTRPWEQAMDIAYEITRAMLQEAEPPMAYIFDAVPNAIAGVRAIAEAMPARLAEVDIIVNAASGGVERYIWPPVTVITCDLGDIVAQAFELFTADVPPDRKVWTVPVAVQPSATGAVSAAGAEAVDAEVAATTATAVL